MTCLLRRRLSTKYLASRAKGSDMSGSPCTSARLKLRQRQSVEDSGRAQRLTLHLPVDDDGHDSCFKLNVVTAEEKLERLDR